MAMVQLQILNKLIQTGDYSPILLNNINDTFFDTYKKEFNFIKDHYEKYNKVPDDKTFLAEFPSFDYPIEVNEPDKYLVSKLFEDKNKSFLVENYNEMHDALMNKDIKKAMEISTSLNDKLSEIKQISSIDLLDGNSRYDAYIDRCNDYNMFYVKTGFKELDNIVYGWDRHEELATIVARPNVGKSWILLKSASAALEQGLTVGLYSGEMSARKVGYRFDTLVEHISNNGIIRGRSDVQNDYKRYIEELPNKFKGKLKVLTPDLIGGPAGVTALRAFIEKEKLDILFVDQHSLLEDDKHAKNPVEKASNISKDLKNLQVMKQIPIISVSQQNRASTENGVDTSHVSASDRISQDSTILLFIEKEKDSNILTLDLVKSRDSVNFKKLKYAVDFDKGIFDFIPEEDSASIEEIENLKTNFEEIKGDNIF